MKKYLFIHIPKTGGDCLKKNLSRDENFIDNYHKKIKRLRTQFKLHEYFKFAFVRNPWDRFVSAYFYLKEVQNNPNHEWPSDIWKSNVINNNFDTFSEFLESRLWTSGRWFHFRPQYNFIINERNVDIDFIGRFENLQEDFDKVCNHIGLPTQKLVPTNTSKHKHYTEYYDNHGRRLIECYYKQDINYFGYQFGE
jgi:chondroitin 4-sulfotransferase 11